MIGYVAAMIVSAALGATLARRPWRRPALAAK
jgi:hypothetical protein